MILEATYGPTCQDNETAGLEVDVTVPLQALVHNSQLYVSNKVPKVTFWKRSRITIWRSLDGPRRVYRDSVTRRQTPLNYYGYGTCSVRRCTMPRFQTWSPLSFHYEVRSARISEAIKTDPHFFTRPFGCVRTATWKVARRLVLEDGYWRPADIAQDPLHLYCTYTPLIALYYLHPWDTAMHMNGCTSDMNEAHEIFIGNWRGMTSR